MSQQPSKACCNVPPAVVDDYETKGSYTELKDGMKCYATGPSSATSAIFIIFDIFGYKPQTLQGADILAHADGPHHQHRVFMPDFFYGKPFAVEDFPPDTPEKQKKLGDFFSGPAKPDATAKKVFELVEELKAQPENSKITNWASLGACWGGKIASLTAQEGTPFSAAAEVHPAMVDPEDAKKITIPLCMLASGDEDAEAVKGFEANCKTKNHVETFKDQVHGWMQARAELGNPRVKEEYERGYKTLLQFYHEHL